jgi:molybdopterin-containing oxidoreductase family iron-sulfur binding subunit
MNSRKDLARELTALQERLGAATSKQYWRSLDELADTEAFREMMRGEFPAQADVWPHSLSRRRFLALMGASLGLAGLTGCAVRPAPIGTIIPYVRAPEELVPGKPLFYATAMTLGGSGVGRLVESHQGRPTKIESNPEHPASLGATDLYHQASILTLYDPDRSQTVTQLGQTRTWDDARTALRGAVETRRGRGGAGIRLLTETVVSPTLGRQIDELLHAFPEMKWHQYEPLGRDAAYRGAVLTFGTPVHTYYRFHDLESDRRLADVVLSLDADFLICGPGNLRYVREFMAGRRVGNSTAEAARAQMNRLYMVETAVTSTGAKADHRLALRGSEIEAFARALAAELQVPGAPAAPELPEAVRRWLRHAAADLRYLDPETGGQRTTARPRGSTVVLAGDRQPAAVHALVHAINHHLGNAGRTVVHTDPLEARPVDQTQSLRELVEDMDADKVEVLIILGGNPVFTAPADFRFVERMQKVPLRVHLSLYQDETSRQCHWHLPEAHYLEAWSDTRAFEGTASIVQPLIEPLYQGRSAHHVLQLLAGQRQVPALELLRGHWQRLHAGKDFDSFWQKSVHDGVVAGTKLPAKSVSLKTGWAQQLPAAPGATASGYELAFQADPTIYDGRFANNGWLQELPKPITTLTWDNAALMSPATAKDLGVRKGSYAHGGEHGGYEMPVVELRLGEQVLALPAWIMPGHADGAITVSLGYGRTHAGRVGGTGDQTVGFDAYPLRRSDRPWFVPGLQVQKDRVNTHWLACTQEHQLMENREVVRSGTLHEYQTKPKFAKDKDEQKEAEETESARKPLTMYEPVPYPGHKWGMLIDLTACTGCKACVVACQAENNIPVVGKEQVLAGREMHWLRIDRYIRGAYDAPMGFYFQPVPCMHCEHAPCEYVCPVEATVHGAGGLNEMIYQRCVGTRFCQNNCPYKVRRFNFLHYADFTTPSIRQQFNPNVTVRSRGVMEKCTYCVQRIRHAEIDALKENRPIFDGEILTACQAACPAEAILFGNLNDAKSKVAAGKKSPREYGLLADLNTNPRTTYLAALRHPNPELEAV